MEVYHLPRMKGNPEFCRTPTATAIDQVIELTYKRGGIALIVTAPGAGKTTVMRAWEAGCEHFDVRYCVATPAEVYSLPRLHDAADRGCGRAGRVRGPHQAQAD